MPQQFSPTPRELDDIELIVSGALPGPLNAPGSPLTLSLPSAVAAAAAEEGSVEIVDPEGLPLARVTWPAGEVTGLSSPAYGPFRRLHLTPSQAREAYAGLGERTDPLVDRTPANLFAREVYERGALTVYATRVALGSTRFRRFTRAWVSRHRTRAASTAEFVALASEIAGRDLGPLLRPWIEAAALPPFPT